MAKLRINVDKCLFNNKNIGNGFLSVDLDGSVSLKQNEKIEFLFKLTQVNEAIQENKKIKFNLENTNIVEIYSDSNNILSLGRLLESEIPSKYQVIKKEDFVSSKKFKALIITLVPVYILLIYFWLVLIKQLSFLTLLASIFISVFLFIYFKSSKLIIDNKIKKVSFYISISFLALTFILSSIISTNKLLAWNENRKNEILAEQKEEKEKIESQKRIEKEEQEKKEKLNRLVNDFDFKYNKKKYYDASLVFKEINDLGYKENITTNTSKYIQVLKEASKIKIQEKQYYDAENLLIESLKLSDNDNESKKLLSIVLINQGDHELKNKNYYQSKENYKKAKEYDLSINIENKIKLVNIEENKQEKLEQEKKVKAEKYAKELKRQKERKARLEKERQARQEKLDYLASCKTYPYKKLSRDADDLSGELIKFSGKIFHIQKQDGVMVLQINVTHQGYGIWNDQIYVSASESFDVYENDFVNVAGVIDGNISYKSVAGWDITVPSVTAAYIWK